MIITQDPAYHQFAHPFGALVSNLAFLLAGLVGLISATTAVRKTAFAGCLLVAFGSAWYHAAPSDPTLVWDRLPMTLVFAAVLTEALAEFVSARARCWLVPLAALGAATVVWWRSTGDLTPYAVLQFGPMLLIPALLVWRRVAPASWLWLLGFYALAKAFELGDAAVWEASGHWLSGHALKHMFAAVALGGWQCLTSRARNPSKPPKAPFTKASQSAPAAS